MLVFEFDAVTGWYFLFVSLKNGEYILPVRRNTVQQGQAAVFMSAVHQIICTVNISQLPCALVRSCD
jgi:hypothetical protein